MTVVVHLQAGFKVKRALVLDELAFTKRAQRLGLTLGETREILGLGRAGRRPCERVAAICAAHLEEIERRIAEL